jgi:hypothetical protein
MEYGSELSEYGESSEFASEQQESVLESIFNEAQAQGLLEGGGYQEYQEYQESPSGEVMEDELAAELLEVRNDQELDHFIGGLISSITGAGRNVASGLAAARGFASGGSFQSALMAALSALLKGAAKKALPVAGAALGRLAGSPIKLPHLGVFGLETEGLSPEDRDFEVARRYVRFARHATKRAAAASPDLDAATVAKTAVVEAAKKFAPGLLAPPSDSAAAQGFAPSAYPPADRGPAAPGAYPSTDGSAYPAEHTCPNCGTTPARHKRQGKWIRRGRHIVLLGV